MTLTDSLQQQLDYEIAIEERRALVHAETEARRTKIETLRMAKEIAMENHKTSPAGTTMTSADIIAFAAELADYANS